jgi:tRNA(fMet)-specific endonuclease VapC
VGVALADARHHAARQHYVSDVIDTIPIEAYDLAVARAHAQLIAHTRTARQPRGAHDLVIAATAAATNRTVVTADHSAFTNLPGVGVRTP